MCENKCTGKSDLTVKVDLMNTDKFKVMVQEISNIINDVNNQLVIEIANCNRFTELYQCSLGYIMKAITEQNVGVLNDAIHKLGEIECKYAK